MNLSVDGKIRNYIFALVLIATITTLIAVIIVGNNQDKAYRDNYMRYKQAVRLIGEQKYSAAQTILNSLDTDSQASYQVLYLQAMCAEGTGDYSAAAGYMQRVRETRPAILQDQIYLYRYGAILYHLNDCQNAQLYLQESIKYKEDNKTTMQARNLLDEINKKYPGGEADVNE
ncbi:MAG: hypothetical protein PHF87_10770 [Desulfotomaculaceae bacterium]|nr:hypothetical protein [Desulfotomaculaceae bacterium]